LPLPERPSIAVLPFDDDSETDQRWFADGIVEDIVLSLASLHELVVISRGSTLGLRAEGRSSGDVGRALGVRYLVTGSIRRAGEALRVWVELGDTVSGETVWTDRMDVAVRDVFAVQDQIVADTVACIAPSIRNAELKRALRKPPETLSAYDALLRALDLIVRLDRKAFQGAASFLWQARETEPGFALPHAWAAWLHMHRAALGWSRDLAADVEQAAEFAQAAVRLDGRNARALATLGHLRSFFHHDHAVGRGYVADALLACPNDPFCWAMSSAGASYVGQHPEAVLHAEKALRLAPFDKYRFYYRAALGLAYYVAGGYEEAVRCGRIAVDENPAFTSNLRYLAASLAAAGQLEEACTVSRALLAQQPEFNLQTYRPRIPFRDDALRALHVEHLRLAGIPEAA
jgi:adenylate cyclase